MILMSTIMAHAQKKIIYINSEKTNCTGVAPMQCLQYKDDINDTQWKLWYDAIEGFSFEPGYYYTLCIKGEPIKSPAADASSIKWTLEKLMKKENADPPLNIDNVPFKFLTMHDAANIIDLSGEKTNLVFRVDKNEMSGKSTCNSFFGKAIISDYANGKGKLKTGAIVTTLRACMDMESEKKMFALLNKVNGFELLADKIILKENATVLFELRQNLE